MRRKPRTLSYAKPKRRNFVLSYMHADKNGNKWGFGTVDGSSGRKKPTIKGIGEWADQIKKHFGYDQVVVLSFQPIRGPR